MKREDILGRIIEEQERVISNLQHSVERYKIASDLDEDDTSDPDDLARQTEAKDMQLRYEKMLHKEKQDLAFVLAEKNKTYTEIEMGALVETDKNYFFMAVPLPKFVIDGKDIFCISSEAPIFSKLKGKKIGDKIEVGNNILEIKNIL
ncbi:MAG: hypothetical protein Q4G16_08445 [Cruoricaptor ignavus]|nr:hypothetical protein [Cruoricaptor ignavus]